MSRVGEGSCGAAALGRVRGAINNYHFFSTLNGFDGSMV
jgi:hypothetical protein